MFTDYLAFRTASRHVQAFSDESEGVLKQRAEATECRDCEYFLQLATDTFDWLMILRSLCSNIIARELRITLP